MLANIGWIVHKDLVTEFRARRVWPTMLLLGIVVAMVFCLHAESLSSQKHQIVGGLLWLAIFFAGMSAIDRSFASERVEGCWEGLKLYPLSPTTVYLAKMLVNALALAVLQCLLIPLFFAFAGLNLLAHPWSLLLIAVLGNLGIAAVGTLLSALATGVRNGGSVLMLLVLPLVIPILLAAAESTRLLVENQINDAWWRWVQLLAALAVIFVTAGTVLYEHAIED